VDPLDKVQTVENFFDFAFLIQNKSVVEDVVDGLPEAIAVSNLTNDVKKQLVISLNMKELSKVCELLKEINTLEAKQTKDTVRKSLFKFLDNFRRKVKFGIKHMNRSLVFYIEMMNYTVPNLSCIKLTYYSVTLAREAQTRRERARTFPILMRRKI
jgi:hypothetical protein